MYGVRSQAKIYPWGARGQGEVLGVLVISYFLIWLCECIHTINLCTFRYTCYIL